MIMRSVGRPQIRHACYSLVAVGICSFLCAHAAEPVTPRNISDLKKELLEYHARYYERDVTSALTEVDAWIRKRASAVQKPAIVLDIDETALSNWEEILANDFAFVPSGPCALPPQLPCGNLAWDESTRATAIGPTLKLYQEARQLGVAVFFVTGRVDEGPERSATELNLWKVGYDRWTGLCLRADKRGTVSTYKTGARITIEQLGYRIIANIGDQENDLSGGHADKAFKVPNPFYLVPEGSDTPPAVNGAVCRDGPQSSRSP